MTVTFLDNECRLFFSSLNKCNLMTSILKAQKANSLNAQANGKRKRKSDVVDEDELEAHSSKKKNKQRVLLLSSRGITHRMRHLMNDLEALLPHVKKGACEVG